MTRTTMLLATLLGVGLISIGCAGEYKTDDDDTYGEDDDVNDDDTTDDDDATDDDDMTDDDDATDDDDMTDDDDTGPSTSCNPWDPIDASGAQWIYESSYCFQMEDGTQQGDFGTETVTSSGSTYVDGSSVYRRSGTFQGQQYTVNWSGYNQCENGGNHDYGSDVVESSGQLSVYTRNTPAVQYLPFNPDQALGTSWNSAYTQEVDMGQGPQAYSAQYAWEVVGVENVNVQAGSFSAVHISASYTSSDPLGNHTGSLDTYWVEGLGLVLWEEMRPQECGTYVRRELVSYSGL